jgi:hypothetical protein
LVRTEPKEVQEWTSHFYAKHGNFFFHTMRHLM